MRIGLAAIAAALGDRSEPNDVLAAEQPAWDLAAITAKTGIRERHVESSGSCLALAQRAAQSALDARPGAQVDALVAVTSTGDRAFPGIACHLQKQLGLPNALFAYDINLGCSGFVYALVTLASLVQAGVAKTPLLVCADTYRKFIAAGDRACRPIFSDAAAATLLGEGERALEIEAWDFGTDGGGAEHLRLEAHPRDGGPSPMIHMNGAAVLLFTMSRVPESVRRVLASRALAVADIDVFLFHQASAVVMDNLQRTLAIPAERFYRNVEAIGNTVSCTIPIGLKELLDAGRLPPGSRVLMCGFGVGLSWATCLVTVH